MKKLLLLGAMAMHIPLLKRAKKRGIYTITCDYLPDNIGHKYANEAHFDSTTDFNAVLNLAKNLAVDAIMTYNSDPAALTAAYVAETLHLPSSGFKAVEIMSEKDKFRNFLRNNNFNTPHFGYYNDFSTFKGDIDTFNFPLIIKPVDSSASKGICKVIQFDDLEKCFNFAIQFSRCKRVIVEEFIDIKGYQLHGDAFVYDGKVKFIYLGDHHFSNDGIINNLAPIATTFPSQIIEEEMKLVEQEVQKFISKVGFKQGGINIEVRIANDNKIYLLEIGARNGGNHVPTAITYASGFDFINPALDSALGLPFIQQTVCKGEFYMQLIIRAPEDGVFEKIEFSPLINSKIVEMNYFIKSQEQISSVSGVNTTVGIAIVKFDNAKEMLNSIDNYNKLYRIIFKDSICE